MCNICVYLTYFIIAFSYSHAENNKNFETFSSFLLFLHCFSSVPRFWCTKQLVTLLHLQLYKVLKLNPVYWSSQLMACYSIFSGGSSVVRKGAVPDVQRTRPCKLTVHPSRPGWPRSNPRKDSEENSSRQRLQICY